MSIKIIAYIYSHPLLESPPSPTIWGWEIDHIYQDLGDRYQLAKLIVDCQLSPPNYLLIRRLEELGDNIPIICDRLEQLESLGIEIITTEENYVSSNFKQINSQELKHQLTHLLAQIQINQQRFRLQIGHARNRLNILPPPGKPPYGYRRGQDKYLVDKSTAPVVKDFFARFLLYGSLRGAVRYLEKRYGKKISPTTGRNWLMNPVYRGDLQYKNASVIANTHTPIIDREEAAQVDRLLRRNRSFAPRTASAPRSLAGLGICQQCQLRMSITKVTQHNHHREYLYLRCQQCPQQPKCKSIDYHQFLTQTINEICTNLAPAVAQLSLPNNMAIATKLHQEIAQKQAILTQLPILVEQGILDEATAALRNYQVRGEISLLNNQIAQLPPNNLATIADAVSIPQFWWDLSEAERRFYFREFIERIEIIRNNTQSWSLKLIFIF